MKNCNIPYFKNLPTNTRITAPAASPIAKTPKVLIHKEDNMPIMPDGSGVGVGVGTGAGVGSSVGTGVATDRGPPEITAVNVPVMPGTAASIVAIPSLAVTVASIKL